jgi:hypothetical protein
MLRLPGDCNDGCGLNLSEGLSENISVKKKRKCPLSQAKYSVNVQNESVILNESPSNKKICRIIHQPQSVRRNVTDMTVGKISGL